MRCCCTAPPARETGDVEESCCLGSVLLLVAKEIVLHRLAPDNIAFDAEQQTWFAPFVPLVMRLAVQRPSVSLARRHLLVISHRSRLGKPLERKRFPGVRRQS
jgi:hypothetical protein